MSEWVGAGVVVASIFLGVMGVVPGGLFVILYVLGLIMWALAVANKRDKRAIK